MTTNGAGFFFFLHLTVQYRFMLIRHCEIQWERCRVFENCFRSSLFSTPSRVLGFSFCETETAALRDLKSGWVFFFFPHQRVSAAQSWILDGWKVSREGRRDPFHLGSDSSVLKVCGAGRSAGLFWGQRGQGSVTTTPTFSNQWPLKL